MRELWSVNEEGEPETEARLPEFRKSDSRRSGVNQIAVSPVDPEAQMFKKPGKTPLLSHKAHFVVDDGKANIITAVTVTGSCESDGRSVGKLLDKHSAALGRPAREMVGDRGYGTEEAVLQCLERHVTPMLARAETINTHGGFSRSEFTYVPERDVYICPAGEELKRFRFKPGPDGAQYRPRKGTCNNCQLRSLSLSGNGDRVIRRSDHYAVIEEMLARLATRRGRQLLKRRQVASESSFADAKQKHGMARAQFRGRKKALIQALLTAAALNLKELAKRRPEAQSGWATAVSRLYEPISSALSALSAALQAAPGPTLT